MNSDVLQIVIEKSSDHYSAYAENVTGVYGAGNSPEEAKKNILEAITLIVKSDDCPKELQKAYTLHFQYDTQSFLTYYSTVFSMPALERLTGINQKQLHHYCSGLKKPRADKKRKIQKALHQLGAELQALELV
jgi:predicted RNase H-like HicB family nuclease